VINGPGFKRSKEVTQLVSLIDIAPTLLRCANLPVPKYMKGYALQDLLNGNAKDWRSEVFIQISESQIGRAIRTERWKYSVRVPSPNGFTESESTIYREDFLYDLNSDPYELNNLVAQPKYKEVRDWLADKLKKKMKYAGERIPEVKPKK
jgi:arylsulfatase A-like enzyme